MKETIEETQLMTIEDVAEYLKVSRSQVKRFMNADVNPLPVMHVSERAPRISLVELKKWVEAKRLKNRWGK